MSCIRVVLVGLVVVLVGVGEVYSGCSVPETYGYVGFWRAYDVGDWCGAEVESTVVRAFRAWGITEESGKLKVRREKTLDNTPEITLSGLKADLSGRRVVLLCTHGGNPQWEGAGFAVEYYKTREAAEAAESLYLEAGYRYDEISVGSVPDGYAVYIKNAGIARHLAPQLEVQDRLIYGDYCWSGHTRDAWSAATFLGYEYSIDVENGCSNLNTVWHRLGCGEWWFFGHQTDDAIRWLNYIHQWGTNTKNQLDCNRGCLDIDARFVDHGAFDDVVWWWTKDEYQSVDFVVRGYRHLDDCPDTLAIVPAEGGIGLLRFYQIVTSEDYRFFDVVERDTRGLQTGTERFCVSGMPEAWEQWLANPEISLHQVAKGGGAGSTEVFEITTKGLIPVDLSIEDSTSIALGPPPGWEPPDSTNCGDVIVYSTVESFANAVAAHCQREGLKVRAFVGSTQDPGRARSLYCSVYNANNTYEDRCLNWVCERHFPRNPLLILVGDAGSVGMVDHYEFGNCNPVDTDCDRCRGNCASDFDITDLNFDGIPEGPVTRIPADSLWEVQLAIKAAEEFNRGINVDSSYHLMLIAGDKYHPAWESWPLPEEILAEVAQGYQGLGYSPLPILVESHFSSYTERQAAAIEQINGGVTELWGFAKVTSSKTWPGDFIINTNDYMNQLTRRQHLIAWMPCCETVADWDLNWYGRPPVAEKFMFNDSTKTNLAACVGHLSGAYEFQHEDFLRILLEERLAAEPGTTVAEVVWRAVKRAQQYPWLFSYARSVAVMGGYVKIPTAPCAAISEDVTRADVLSLDIEILPNPIVATSQLKVRIGAPKSMAVTVDVYDVRGRHVRRLYSGILGEGVNDLHWRLEDSGGRKVSPGVYFLRLSNSNWAQTRKIVIVE